MGGASKEREISLETGLSCIKALKKLKYKVVKFDPKFSPISDLKKKNVDIIFNALHGKGGEDGNIQSFFEHIGLPYTHSGPLASMLAMNKDFSKQLFIKNKISTPRYFYLNKINFTKKNIKKKIKNNKLKFPIVIKPNDEGSSIGVSICKNYKSLNNYWLQKQISFNRRRKSYKKI